MTLHVSAQTTFQIQGAVVDAQTKESLTGVNIFKMSEPLSGDVTNQDGVFKIEITELPTTLSFSFIGYETKTLKIENAETREYIVELRPSTTNLPEVSVSDRRKIDTVFFKPYSVVDYVFFENKIILLAHRDSRKKYILIALDEKTNEPIAEFSLTEHSPKGLFQHCTGEVFLVTEANVHELAIDETGIHFPRKIFLGDFYLIDHPCVIASEKFLYFARYFYQGQALKYFAFTRNFTPEQQNGEAAIPTDSLAKFEFPLIQNEPEIVRLIEEVGLRLPWSGDVWDENINERLLTLKESDYGLRGIMKIFYPKINAPLFQKNEELIIFNHREAELQFFSPQGDSIRSIPIDYHRTRKWKKQVLFDEIQQRAYTTFNTRWGEKIQEIDLENGQVKSPLQIDLAFIENPKVRDGYIYFLYKNTWGQTRRRVLQRMKVD